MAAINSKFWYKVLSILIITLFQCVGLVLSTTVYLYFFPYFSSSLNMGVSLHFYAYIFFPIAMLLSNSITVFSKKRAWILFFGMVALVGLLYYWGGNFLTYPFKVGYIIFLSIILYLLGLLIASRIRDWIS